jgi:hypothetical protein
MKKFLLFVLIFATVVAHGKNAVVGDPDIVDCGKGAVINDSTAFRGDTAFIMTDVMHSFPGGCKGLFKWLSSKLIYPPEVAMRGISGTVYVQFTIRCG